LLAQGILILVIHLFFAWRVYLCELLWFDQLTLMS